MTSDSATGTVGLRQPAEALTAAGKPAPKAKPYPKKAMVDLFRGLGSMLRAQINTADALKYYAAGLSDKTLSDTLLQIRDDIGRGMNVHEAFRRTGRFSEMIVGLIQAGSDAGQLHHAFNSLGARLKSEMFFSKQIRKATLMPCIIIAVLIGAFIVSQVKIVPQVEEMMKGVGAKADGVTALSFKISHFTKAVWPFVVTVLIGSVLTIAYSLKVRQFILGLVMARWRLLRLLLTSLHQLTFLSTIRLLHSNGINLAKSIRVGANSVRNTPYYAELNEAADKYENSGVPLSTAFAKFTSVDSQVVHMLAIGERSASLDTQLEMLSEMYEEDTQNHMAAFSAAIGFLVMVIAMLMIAAVFLGTYLPIFMMGPKMMQGGL